MVKIKPFLGVEGLIYSIGLREYESESVIPLLGTPTIVKNEKI